MSHFPVCVVCTCIVHVVISYKRGIFLHITDSHIFTAYDNAKIRNRKKYQRLWIIAIKILRHYLSNKLSASLVERVSLKIRSLLQIQKWHRKSCIDIFIYIVSREWKKNICKSFITIEIVDTVTVPTNIKSKWYARIKLLLPYLPLLYSPCCW